MKFRPKAFRISNTLTHAVARAAVTLGVTETSLHERCLRSLLLGCVPADTRSRNRVAADAVSAEVRASLSMNKTGKFEPRSVRLPPELVRLLGVVASSGAATETALLEAALHLYLPEVVASAVQEKADLLSTETEQAAVEFAKRLDSPVTKTSYASARFDGAASQSVDAMTTTVHRHGSIATNRVAVPGMGAVRPFRGVAANRSAAPGSSK